MRKKVLPEDSKSSKNIKDNVQTIKRKLTAEDSYFAQRDQELIEKNARERKTKEEEEKKAQEQSSKSKKVKKCFDCGSLLEAVSIKKTIVDKCPDCGGVWLDSKDIQKILQKEANLFNSMMDLFLPKEK